MRIFIWGTGHVAHSYLCQNEVTEKNIIGFIQTDRTLKEWKGIKVYEPNEIGKVEYDYILVCIYGDAENIINTCNENMIPLEKVLFIDSYEWIDGSAMRNIPGSLYRSIGISKEQAQAEKYFPIFRSIRLGRENELKEYHITKRNKSDHIEDNLLQSGLFEDIAYKLDYFRYRTFELTANEIERNGVCGNCAEVGVYRGEFARLINARFKDRIMYLFDTFESFDKNEYIDELANGNCSEGFRETFTDTSIEKVLRNMVYPEKCIPRVGFFPATAVGLEGERYAFVSIDVDFEKSILEGLRYFYPRMNEGGRIFIHDYNNCFLGGVKNAVDRYEEENKIRIAKVPIADEGGTLIIVKQ